MRPEYVGDVFQQLEIPAQDLNLGIGSEFHRKQTGNMLIRLEALMTVVRSHLLKSRFLGYYLEDKVIAAACLEVDD